jgi:hypothetical protein
VAPKQRLPGSWYIQFFRRHKDDDPNQTIPGREFLRGDGRDAAMKLQEILQSVASAPPPSWPGGGTWEAMKGKMAGYYEARTRLGTWLYRLFCFLERDVEGLPGPSIVVITGMRKKNLTAFSDADYAKVRALGNEYKARVPRSVG